MTPPKGVILNFEKFSCRMERYFPVNCNRLETNPFYSRVLKKLDPSRDGRMVRHFPVGSIFPSVKGHCRGDYVVCCIGDNCSNILLGTCSSYIKLHLEPREENVK